LSCQRIINTAVLGAALCASMAVSAETPGDFASQTPLTLSGEGPWYRLELPLNVQLNARQSDLGDVRVFNAEGQPQAYALALDQAQYPQDETPIPVKWFPLYNSNDARDAVPSVRVERTTTGTLIQVQPQRGIEAGEEVLRGWLLDTSTIKAPLNQLILDWSAEHDGLQRFSIEASDDLQHWQAWGEGQVARLAFADELVEQREVGLPGRNARYLRLLWHSPQTAPTLTSAQIVGAHTGSLPQPLAWSEPFAGKVDKPGEYSWQLPTGLALERLKFDIAQPNSLAPGTLYGRTDAKGAWQVLGSGLLYRLTQNGQDVVQDEIQLPGLVAQQLKLEVDERGGGLGAEAPKLQVAVRATQLVFLARGSGPYVLTVGSSTVKAANLPLATLIPDYSVQKLAELGTAKLISTLVVPAIPAAPPAESSIDFKRVGLWAVLVIGVLLLGWMAISTLRASRTKP